MRGDPAEPGPEFHRALVPDRGIVGRGFADDNGACLPQQAFDLDQMPRTDATTLLCRCQYQNHACGRAQMPGQVLRREQNPGDPGFHVGRSAAVEPVPVGFAGERIPAPGCRTERHGIDMSCQAQRRLGVRATEPRDHTGALVGVLVVLDRVAPVLKQATDATRAFPLVARGIDRVELEQVAGQGDFIGGVHCGNSTVVSRQCAGGRLAPETVRAAPHD